MSHPNDFATTTEPARGDGVESSLRKINALLASGTKPNSMAPTASVTIGASATTLVEAGLYIHGTTRTLVITIEDADVRMCPEGGTPTSVLGQPVPVDSTVSLSLDEATSAKWIRSGSSNATLQVSQYTA